MTEKERELLLAWIFNEESLAAILRYDDFKEFGLIVIRLLNLDR